MLNEIYKIMEKRVFETFVYGIWNHGIEWFIIPALVYSDYYLTMRSLGIRFLRWEFYIGIQYEIKFNEEESDEIRYDAEGNKVNI